MSTRSYSGSFLAYAQDALNGMFSSSVNSTKPPKTELSPSQKESQKESRNELQKDSQKDLQKDFQKDPQNEQSLESQMEEMAFEGSETSGWTEESWIQSFLSMDGNEFFTEVSDDFLMDDFNLTGLNGIVPYFHQALDVLQEVDSQEPLLTEEQQIALDQSCMELYGMIHARYILTSRGLSAMCEKYQAGHFGYCPRVLCQNQHVLPVGISDSPRRDTVKLFCPRCEEVYNPPSRKHNRLDGAYFGTTFPHMFLLAYPELIPLRAAQKYVPRMFGFKIHSSSRDRLIKTLKAEKTDPQDGLSQILTQASSQSPGLSSLTATSLTFQEQGRERSQAD
eukprot:TRINITY_DN10151_c0_g2_i1.p1 TRINITY_DN10151_c0_g2~~TRINITY_DN10151_c0_g2_i1.p1  ORF type:complete len:336 (+),score=62.28 TRINITY_DN10151_c0_g2_i1:67-1074(+)